MEMDRTSQRRPGRVRQGSLWKFNVGRKNLPACIEHSLFADDQQRHLIPGDLLLLEQTKSPGVDAHRRITHILEFDHYEQDMESLSRQLWGQALQVSSPRPRAAFT